MVSRRLDVNGQARHLLYASVKAAIATRGIPRILAAARFSPALRKGNGSINHAFQTD
jgi:hypothetical protein